MLLDAAATSPVFTATAAPYLLLDADLTIRAVNDAYLRATRRARDDLVGREMFDAFPDNPADESATGVSNLSASFNRVLREAIPHRMAVQRYDVAPSGTADFIHKVWSPVNSPITDERGRALGVLHHVEDLSQLMTDEMGPSADPRRVAVAAVRYRRAHDLLLQENSRLTDALTAVGASRGSTDYAGTGHRRRQLWRMLAMRTAERSRRGWSASLCALVVDAFDTVEGAATSVQKVGGRSALVAASDPRASRMEGVSASLQEGPARAALLTGVPVHVADVSRDDTLWPDYAAAAIDAGVVGVSAFPMLLGSDIVGTFTVYRTQGFAPDHGEWIDTAIAADLAVSALLADDAHIDELAPTRDPFLNVTIAASALSLQFDISLDEAVNRLRRRADRLKVPVRDVAAEVVWRWSDHSQGQPRSDRTAPGA